MNATTMEPTIVTTTVVRVRGSGIRQISRVARLRCSVGCGRTSPVSPGAPSEGRYVAKGFACQQQYCRVVASVNAYAVEEGGPGTLPNRCAWFIAEEAAHKLGAQVDMYFPARTLITATGDRLRKRG